MDQLEHVKKLREDYERALDAAESRRAAYHEAVLELHQDGTPLREIAQQLGLSHQRVHQIVAGDPPRGGKLRNVSAGGAAAVVLMTAFRLVSALARWSCGNAVVTNPVARRGVIVGAALVGSLILSLAGATSAAARSSRSSLPRCKTADSNLGGHQFAVEAAARIAAERAAEAAARLAAEARLQRKTMLRMRAELQAAEKQRAQLQGAENRLLRKERAGR